MLVPVPPLVPEPVLVPVPPLTPAPVPPVVVELVPLESDLLAPEPVMPAAAGCPLIDGEVEFEPASVGLPPTEGEPVCAEEVPEAPAPVEPLTPFVPFTPLVVVALEVLPLPVPSVPEAVPPVLTAGAATSPEAGLTPMVGLKLDPVVLGLPDVVD